MKRDDFFFKKLMNKIIGEFFIYHCFLIFLFVFWRLNGSV